MPGCRLTRGRTWTSCLVDSRPTFPLSRQYRMPAPRRSRPLRNLHLRNGVDLTSVFDKDASDGGRHEHLLPCTT